MAQPKLGDSCRWGVIDNITPLCQGVVFVSTPSHGGVWISAEHEASIPDNVKKPAREYAPAQWYEEDSDCIIPLALIEGVPIAERQYAINAAYNDRERGRYHALLAHLIKLNKIPVPA